jgi:PAS domain S-box-containing protein
MDNRWEGLLVLLPRAANERAGKVGRAPTRLLGRLSQMSKTPDMSPTERSLTALFAQLAAMLSSTEDLDQFFTAGLQLIEEVLGVEGCSIFLIDASDKRLKVKASTGIPQAEWESIRIPLGEGVAGKVAASGEPIWAETLSDLAWIKDNPSRKRYKTDSFISMPIKMQGQTIGVINVDSKKDRARFSRNEVDLLKGVAGLFATALDNARLLDERTKEKALFDSILQSVSMGVMAFNSDMLLTHANSAAAGQLGFSRSQVGKILIGAVFPEEKAKKISDLVEELDSHGAPVCAEIELAREDQASGIPLGLTFAALRDTGGEQVGFIIVTEDLTIRRQVSELRHLSQLRSQFLSLISHELRTPLTAIKGAVHLLVAVKDLEVSDAQKRVMDVIGRNVTRLASLIDDMLEVQGLEADRVELALQPVNLCQLVEESLKSRQPLWAEKCIKVSCGANGAAPVELRLDRDRIRQVMNHLIDNAFKFCNPQGEVKVELAEDDGKAALVRISNTGEPIPAESHDRIFDIFYQVEPTMTRRSGGSGLGLYLARELARLHYGDVLLEKSDGHGTTFVVRLPLNVRGGPLSS